MLEPYATHLHPLFRDFVEKFIIDGNSLVSSDTLIVTPETISNCFKNYVENYQTGKSRFGEKVEEQFKNADLPTKLVFAHAEWLWAFAVNDIGVWRKKEGTKLITGLAEEQLNQNAYQTGFGSAGTYHKNNKYEEIKFNLLLIRFLREKAIEQESITIEEIIEWTEKVCLYQKYGQLFEGYPLPGSLTDELKDSAIAMCNIICFVAKPEIYERIASDGHKSLIYNAFSGLLNDLERTDENKNIDQKIFEIRTKIGQLIKNQNFDFYDEDDVVVVWNYNLNQEGFTVIQGLQYKKAIILYGPPGTSKTHTAKNLANVLIRSAYLKNRGNVEKFFTETEDYTKDRIHHLQLHSNYTYEDFVAGMLLKDHNIVPEKGKLFKICEAAEKERESQMPHVLILDEINRVDLSRLLGEVFSALENRNKPIEIGVGNLLLTIPDNLYVIGTMNEIDFSLERIDFALRRRFLWFPFGFDAGTLRSIINYKNKELKTNLKSTEIDRYIQNAINLNIKIKALPELGEQYQIGHTFFGEIVEIYQKYKEAKGYVNTLQKQIFRGGDGPACILWDISVKPMIAAFLGNMDQETKNENLNTLFDIYNNES